jgi:hypothetical protein
MTIGEHLQQQIRIGNRVKWAGIFAVLVVTAVEVFSHRSRAETYTWMAVVMVPWIVAIIVLGRRVKCQRCQKNLYKELVIVKVPTMLALFRDATRECFGDEPLPLEACPQCGCRFSEPYVGG